MSWLPFSWVVTFFRVVVFLQKYRFKQLLIALVLLLTHFIHYSKMCWFWPNTSVLPVHVKYLDWTYRTEIWKDTQRSTRSYMKSHCSLIGLTVVWLNRSICLCHSVSQNWRTEFTRKLPSNQPVAKMFIFFERSFLQPFSCQPEASNQSWAVGFFSLMKVQSHNFLFTFNNFSLYTLTWFWHLAWTNPNHLMKLVAVSFFPSYKISVLMVKEIHSSTFISSTATKF